MTETVENPHKRVGRGRVRPLLLLSTVIGISLLAACASAEPRRAADQTVKSSTTSTTRLPATTTTQSPLDQLRLRPNGGYPFAEMPCAQEPHAVHGKRMFCGNYDFSTPDSGPFSKEGYGYRNCTDWVSFRLGAFGVQRDHRTFLGNANQWPAKASSRGLTVSATPLLHSAAVNMSGGYGHVAFIEAMNADGTITVSEYNALADGEFRIWTGTAAERSFTEFINFEVP